MIRVRLYGKPDCHLCDEAMALLETLSREFALQIEKIDITRDAELFARYRYLIPVLEIGETLLYPPIERDRVRRALEIARG